MDWPTFFSANIKSLAWPTVALIALFVLRPQLTQLLRALGNRLRSFKAFGVETTFAEGVDQVEELVPAPKVTEINSSFSASGRWDADAQQRIENISELSRLPPPYIISQAWLRPEQAIREAVDSTSFPTATGKRPLLPPAAYLHLASVSRLLSDDEMPAVQKLRELRNEAAHLADPGITITDALRYHDIANNLIEKINQRRQHMPAHPT